MSPIIPISVLLAVSILISKHFLFPLLVSPLRHIPQLHWTSRFSSLYLSYIRRNGKTGMQRIFFAHQKTKSPIILLSPNELSVASLDGLKQVYLGSFEKTSWYAAEL